MTEKRNGPITTWYTNLTPIILIACPSAIYNIAPAKAETTIIHSIPKPVLLTLCGAKTTGAAPVLCAESDGAVVLPPLPLALDPLLVALGVPVAVAVLFPLQKIELGLTPPSMKHFCKSPTDCSTERQ